MKKSIAALLIGSALLLPNNNSVEASSSNNEVKVKIAQYVQYSGWEGKQFHFNNLQPVKFDFNGYTLNLENLQFKDMEAAKPAPSAPVAQPKAPTPEAKPTPEKPIEKPVEKKVPTPTPAKAPTPAPAKESTPAPAPTPAPEVPVEKPVEATQDASVSAIEKAVLDLTNVERQKAGLQPLQTDSKLMNSARQKSTDMATQNYFSHTSPTYGSPFDQMKANGISYRSAAENIAMGQRTAEEVVKGWMESPGHKQNILTPDFTHIGIGYDQNGNYWTQQFISK